MSSVERLMDDRLQPIAVEAKGRYGDGFLRAIDAALAVRPQDRPQNEAQFRALLDIDLPTPPPSPPLSGYGALSHEAVPGDAGQRLLDRAGHADARSWRHRCRRAPPSRRRQRRRGAAGDARAAGRQAPARQMPAPATDAPGAGHRPMPRRRRAPCRRLHRPCAGPGRVERGSRTLVLGAAALLVVSGLAFGVYWTLQSRDDDAAKPAAPAASAIALPASAAAAVVSAERGARIVGRPAAAVPEVASAPVASVRRPRAPRARRQPRRSGRSDQAGRGRTRDAGSSPRREPAVAASAPPRPRREPARVEPPAESRPSPGYPSELSLGERRQVQ